MRLQFFAAILIVCTACSCGNRTNQQSNATTTPTAETQTTPFKLSSPTNGSIFTTGDTITLAYTSDTNSYSVDSCVFSVNGKDFTQFNGDVYKWSTANSKVGSLALKLVLWSEGKTIATLQSNVKVYPQAPQFYTYQVIKEYPHNTESYTQGLFIHNDAMYESTGTYGHSVLSRVDLATGKALQTTRLEDKYFGEGSAILNDKIYVLTYESRKGLVYDATSFKQVGEFAYDTEGWGLTTDGELLIMSDGSSVIRFMTPDTFKEVRRIEVCTDKGHVNMINELEYIDGEIWANIYTQPAIICINANTGAVTKVVNMQGLQPESSKNDQENVLNGIAYNHKTKQFYITGKRWPKLFEVKFEPRKQEGK